MKHSLQFSLLKKDLPRFLFFLTLIFLPQQFGPHFWPAFSYVHGIRLDYLSPSLYISDILILLLFLLSAQKVLSSKLSQKLLSSPLFLLFLFTLIIPLTYVPSTSALLYGILKLVEFLFFGLFAATQLKKADLTTLIEIFAILGVLEAILAVFQFLHQGSVGGLLYFLGERHFTAGTPGIALMNTAQGLLVRPYGTFPHPNVLAFFLFMSAVFASYGMHQAKMKLRRYLLLSAVICVEAGLFITFSRTVVFINILFLLYAYGFVTLKEGGKRIKNIFFVGFLLFFVAVYLLLNNVRFLEPSSFIKGLLPRFDLIEISVSAIKTYPLFGTGLNNFYYYEVIQQKSFNSVYLQPVHNIFLFVAASIGIIGLLLFLYFLTVAFINAVKNVRTEKKLFSFSEIPLILLLSIVFLGLFDHYFLTVQQGLLLFAFIVGLPFSKAITTRQARTIN